VKKGLREGRQHPHRAGQPGRCAKDTLQLVITAARLLSAPGLAFDGNNDGPPGGDAVVSVKV
jgi:hypothetical protein